MRADIFAAVMPFSWGRDDGRGRATGAVCDGWPPPEHAPQHSTHAAQVASAVTPPTAKRSQWWDAKSQGHSKYGAAGPRNEKQPQEAVKPDDGAGEGLPVDALRP